MLKNHTCQYISNIALMFFEKWVAQNFSEKIYLKSVYFSVAVCPVRDKMLVKTCHTAIPIVPLGTKFDKSKTFFKFAEKKYHGKYIYTNSQKTKKNTIKSEILLKNIWNFWSCLKLILMKDMFWKIRNNFINILSLTGHSRGVETYVFTNILSLTGQ